MFKNNINMIKQEEYYKIAKESDKNKLILSFVRLNLNEDFLKQQIDDFEEFLISKNIDINDFFNWRKNNVFFK